MLVIVKQEKIQEEGLEYLVTEYSNGTVTKELYSDKEPEPAEEPISQDEINAEILLNQAQIMETQNAQDEVLAEILLNSVQ